MAMSGTASNHSPRHSSDNLNSPQRAAKSVVSSPWNQIVRGESEPMAASPSSPSSSAIAAESFSVTVEDSSSAAESLDNGSGANVNTGKRTAWNKPSNGAASEIKPVMGAVSWPALSESTRATMKSPSESSKGLTDGSSVTQLQGTGTAPSSSQRQVGDNANANNVIPIRQKSIKRNGSNASSNGGHLQQSAPQGPLAGTGSHNSSPKDHTQRSGFVSQSHNVNDHPQQRNSFRNRNGGPHQRGDGSHHHNYGNRREQDRGNQDWNAHRNFNGRDTHMPPRVVPRFVRPPPPPNSAQFIPPPPGRPFGGPIGFPELAAPMVYLAGPPQESLRGVPFVAPIPPHAMFFPAPDPHLHTKIVNQIDYYFSNDNLIKDVYLRRNMDDQGWVPINLIAGFNKVSHLTDNIQLILDAVRTSSVVEVQGDKIRRRNDWNRWIMSPVQFRNVTVPTTNNDGARGLDVQLDASQNRTPFGELNSPMQPSAGDRTGQVGFQGSDHTISARNEL